MGLVSEHVKLGKRWPFVYLFLVRVYLTKQFVQR